MRAGHGLRQLPEAFFSQPGKYVKHHVNDTVSAIPSTDHEHATY